MIRTIFFDLDDTILDFRKAEAIALSKALREFGVDPTPQMVDRYHVLNISQWELLEDGALTRPQVLTRRFDLLFEELGVELSSRAVCDCYEEHLAEGHIFMPGAEEVLRQLAPRYDLYLASNGSVNVQRGRLQSAGITELFQGLFVSEEIGFDKPKAEYFDACFAKIPNFSRETAIIVGDSLTSDIRGGINAGIRTCWYDPFGKPTRPDIIPDDRITDLKELPNLLERI